MKKQTLMRIASAAMSSVMALSVIISTGLTSYAASSAQKEAAMKAALTKVKLRVDIPERISEFRYSTDRNYNTDCYHFTWSTPSGENVKAYESISINIVEDIITSYNYYINYVNKEDDPGYERKQSFAKLSDAQMISKAKEYVKMLNPDIYSEAEYFVNNISLFDKNASVSFDRKKNGITVDGNGGTVTIDKDTGELYGFSATWFEKETSFADASKRLSNAKAIESYKDLCELTPAYTISYNWETEQKEAVLVYRPSFTGEIDAFTGKPSTIWEDMQKDGGYRNPPWSWSGSYHYSNTAGAGVDMEEEECADDVEDAGSGEGVSFTEAELREIDTAKGLLSKEEVTKMLQNDKYVKLPSWAPLRSSNLYKDDATEEYFYYMYFYNDGDIEYEDKGDDGVMPINDGHPYYNLRVNLNAKTGKIIDYSRSYDANLDDSSKYPVTANNKKAEEVIAYFYPEVYKEYKASENNTKPSEVTYYDSYSYKEANPSTGPSSKGKAHYETVRTFRYDRYVNGVIVEGDSINVSIDNNGNVYSVNGKHTDVKFPPVPKFDKNKAFEQLFKQTDLQLYYDGYYKKDGTIKTYLLFNVDSFTLDSKYRLVNYSGRVIENRGASDTDYIDIKGSKYEKAITTLARYGITLPSENNEFKPNATLTDKEFAIIVYGVTRSYVPYNIKNGGYNGEESKPVTLTNAEAAKVFVTVSGGAEYAELKDIYKAPYSDVPTSSKYVGYISIAKAKGYMKGSGGKFSPNAKISRGRAMQIVYDYIKNLK